MGVAAVLLLTLASALLQVKQVDNAAGRLLARLTKLQAARAASTAAIQSETPPDVVQTLPNAPQVAQVLQTLQQAAETEGVQVASVQAEEHAATPTTLGHLDLIISMKASYPAIVVVIQQVLDRYPGATLRQLSLARTTDFASTLPVATTPNASGAAALPAASPSEAHVTLSFWSRPQGVPRVLPIAANVSSPASAPLGASAGQAASAASAAIAARAPSQSAARRLTIEPPASTAKN